MEKATANELLKTAIRVGEQLAVENIDARTTAALRLHAIRAAALLMDRGKIDAARKVLQKVLDQEQEEDWRWD